MKHQQSIYIVLLIFTLGSCSHWIGNEASITRNNMDESEPKYEEIKADEEVELVTLMEETKKENSNERLRVNSIKCYYYKDYSIICSRDRIFYGTGFYSCVYGCIFYGFSIWGNYSDAIRKWFELIGMMAIIPGATLCITPIVSKNCHEKYRDPDGTLKSCYGCYDAFCFWDDI